MNALVLSKKARLYPKAKALGFSLGTFDKITLKFFRCVLYNA